MTLCVLSNFAALSAIEIIPRRHKLDMQPSIKRGCLSWIRSLQQHGLNPIVHLHLHPPRANTPFKRMLMVSDVSLYVKADASDSHLYIWEGRVFQDELGVT